MNRKPAEFWLMLLVIAITAWHVRSFLATKDHEVASWIIGAVLGACCFLFAHRFFSGGAARIPAFFALAISAAYSVNMQYAYFDAKDILGNALIYDVYGWNLNALVLGLWAPTFEILLGWLYSAMMQGGELHTRPGKASAWAGVSNAIAGRIVAQLQPAQPVQKPVQLVQESVHTVQSATVQDSADAQSNSAVVPKQRAKLLKSEGLTNAQIALELNVHRNTVGTWLRSTNGHSKAEAHT